LRAPPCAAPCGAPAWPLPDPQSLRAAMPYFAASKEHNVKLRAIAIRKGLKLNEYGVFPADDDAMNLASNAEDDVYAAIGLPWIPPELREGAGEVELARTGRLPRLVELGDIKGDLHTHTRLA